MQVRISLIGALALVGACATTGVPGSRLALPSGAETLWVESLGME